jgi:hypothetical protein
LLGIGKRCNGYVRKLLMHGAGAVLMARQSKSTYTDDWAVKLAQRREHNFAVCAWRQRMYGASRPCRKATKCSAPIMRRQTARAHDPRGG